MAKNKFITMLKENILGGLIGGMIGFYPSFIITLEFAYSETASLLPAEIIYFASLAGFIILGAFIQSKVKK